MATTAGRQWGEAAGGEREGLRRTPELEEFLGEAAVRSFQTGAETPGEGSEARGEETRNTAAWGTVPQGGGAPVRDQNEGDPWQNEEEDPWWRSSTGHQEGWWQGGWAWRSDSWSADWWTSDREKGKDYSDPPAWAGWANYRLWRKAVVRWDQATDVQPRRRAERIFKTMDWELQAKFEHIEDADITSEEYLKHLLYVLDTLSGECAAVDKRRAVRKALFEGQRRDGETISQFTLRREQEFAMAEKYLALPGDLKAMMLEEQASLGRQGTMNLRTLTSGSSRYEDVVKALRVLDMDEEGFTATKGRPTGFVAHTRAEAEAAPAEDTGEEDAESLGSEDVQDILAEVEKMDLAEDEAMEVFLALEKEKKTWKENKKLKMARRKDRRHFAGKPSGDRRPRLSTEQLKKVSRCSNCGEKGHWAEDCSKPYRSKADRLAQEAKKRGEKSSGGGFKGAAFVFLGGGGEENFSASSFSGMAIPWRVQEVLNRFRKGTGDDASFLTLAPGLAIIDPGAGQDLIGLEAYRRLEGELAKGGLRTVRLTEKPAPASGVGGRASTMFTALVPCILGGAAGVVKVTVVEEDIPHLLSIGLLESAGAVINTASNVIEFRNIGTEDSMVRIKSGHRVLNIAKWSGEQFPVPEEVKDQYGLEPGAFNLPSEACEVYMGGQAEGVRDHWKQVEDTPILLRVHQEYRDRPFQPGSNDPGCSLLETRVSVKCLEDGTCVTETDNWRACSEVGDQTSAPWTGYTLFLRAVNDKARIGRAPSLGAKCFQRPAVNHRRVGEVRSYQAGEAESTSQSFPVGSAHEPAWREDMGWPEGKGEARARGSREEEGRREGREEARGVHAPTHSRGAGSQPVRQVGEVPEVSDQDLLRATQQETTHQEGEGLCGRVRQGAGSRGGREGRQEEEGNRGGRELVSRECSTVAGDADGEQCTAPTGDDAHHVPGDHPGGARTTSSDADDPAVHRQPDPDDASRPRQSERSDASSDTDGSDYEGGGVGSGESGGTSEGRVTRSEPEAEESTKKAESEEEGSGPSGGQQEEEEEEDEEPYKDGLHVFPSIKNMENYKGGAGALERVYLGKRSGECGEWFICSRIPQLEDQLEDEDLNDDYEAGVPKNVRKETQKTIGVLLAQKEAEKGERKRDLAKEYTVMEIFSPPRVTKACQEKGIRTTSLPAFDLSEGWDFFNPKHRKELWRVLTEEEPDLVVLTPECKAFSQMMNVNWERMSAEEVERVRVSCMAMFQFCIRVAEHQIRNKKHFLLEQPDGASSWDTQAAKWLAMQLEVESVSFDQCRFGLNPSGRGLSKKRTRFMLNQCSIYDEFVDKDCTGDHEHVRLEGGLTSKARIWPKDLVDAIVRGIQRERRYLGNNQWVLLGEADAEEEEEGEEEEDEEQEEHRGPTTVRGEVEKACGLTTEQKEMVRRLHHNMGHLPLDRMIVMLKAAKAKENVLKYVRDEFQCEACMRQRREITRRKAAFPRTFEFNRVVGVDTFFVKWKGKNIPFLNVVDHGTNWQMVTMVRPVGGGEPTGGNPTSNETWHHFLKSWVRPFGVPQVVLSDGGMEFRDRYERGLEQLGTLQTVTDQESPWQNGRVERHGQWLKDRAEMETGAASTVITNINDLEEFLMELVVCKNSWFNRGGYSPAQLVYGRNPRLPAELLSDASQDSPGWQDILCDPTEMDTAASEFKKSHEIRQRARRLAMEQASREKVRDASKPPLHKHRVWTAGQWVLVWRLSKAGNGRHRWVGPGLVILQNGHTVYVAMRSRLWKCNVDQLRPATQTEELGMEVIQSMQYKDLLQQMQKQRQGAIDVEKEGPPPEDAWRNYRIQEEEAPTLSLPQQDQSERRTEGDLPMPLEHPQNRAVIVGPMPEPTRRGAPSIGPDSRRGSIGTISEPASEPRGPLEEAEMEVKRRRTLPPVPEEGTGADASSSSTPPAAETRGERAPRSEAASSQPLETATVSQRVQDIEDRIEGRAEGDREPFRRRSRSPLPDVLLRRKKTEAERSGPDPDEESFFAGGEEARYREGTQKELSHYKEMSRRYVERNRGEDEQGEAEEDLPCLLNLSTQAGNWAVEVPRNGEITWKEMTEEEVKMFQDSDLTEWDSLEKEFKAVKVWRGEEAEALRKKFQDRIMTARVVRRKKPTPGLHQFKAKSRFCVHGHKDPDGGTFRTFAPTPTTEALHMVCQIIANHEMRMLFADVKAAFAQANKLVRPRGRLFVEPCDGTPLRKNDLIELIAPVYGLDDAPLRWFETIGEYLQGLGFRRSLLDPCVFTKHEEGELRHIVLIEVDDFLIASKNKEDEERLQENLCSRFKFGK